MKWRERPENEGSEGPPKALGTADGDFGKVAGISANMEKKKGGLWVFKYGYSREQFFIHSM